MQRLMPHQIEPAPADGEVLKTSDGVATWGPVPGGATALDDLTDVDTSTTAPVDGNALVFDGAAAQWKPGAVSGAGGGSLDDLTDVDTTTTSPSGGQALVYNATSGLWEPGTISGGGPSVGAWESNVVASIATPTPVEHDLQAAPLTIPATRPAAALWSHTITSGDLVTCDDPELGIDPLFVVWVAINGSAGAATNHNVQLELMVNGVVRGNATAASVSTTRRGGATLPARSASVGDVVELRAWQVSPAYTGSGDTIDWIARGSRATSVGRQMPSSGRYLYRRAVVLANSGNWQPSTSLAWVGVWSVNRQDWDLYNETVNSGGTTLVASQTVLLPDPVNGLLRLENLDQINGNVGVATTATTGPSLVDDMAPTQIRFDRLAIPDLPA